MRIMSSDSDLANCALTEACKVEKVKMVQQQKSCFSSTPHLLGALLLGLVLALVALLAGALRLAALKLALCVCVDDDECSATI